MSVAPFLSYRKISWKTSLDYEIITISSVLDTLGFRVDVVNNYGPFPFINLSSYDYIIGEGPLIHLLYSKYSSMTVLPKCVYIGTTAHPWINNSLGNIARARFMKSNLFNPNLRISRQLPNSWGFSACLADYLIVYGDEYIRQSYLNYTNSPVFNIPCSTNIINHQSLSPTDLSVGTQKDVLFISGAGLLHKGFDVVIEIAKTLDKFNFHIFADIKTEIQHFKLNSLPKNVIVHGFVDVNSKYFLDLSRRCFCVISPSASEGCSVALANAVYLSGCIPITSSMSGINSFVQAYQVEYNSPQFYTRIILALSEKDITALLNERIAFHKKASKLFSRDTYRTNVSRIFHSILTT